MSEDKTGPQFDPQPGDTMASSWGSVFTVVRHSVGDVECTYKLADGREGVIVWTYGEWSCDGHGDYVWCRPAALGAAVSL